MIRSTTTTKDEVKFKLAEEIDKDGGE